MAAEGLTLDDFQGLLAEEDETVRPTRHTFSSPHTFVRGCKERLYPPIHTFHPHLSPLVLRNKVPGS
eukprot:70348-Chlamydomonas_euryale.AAC.1